MKRIILVLFTIILMLSSCTGGTVTEYTVEHGGKNYTVNTENCTITDGENTYTYSVSGSADSYNMEIKYPDGSTAWWTMNGSSGHGGWSDNYVIGKYPDINTISSILEKDLPSHKGGGNAFMIILLIIIGLANIIAPYASWYLSYGWRYKNAEPSDAALVMNRIGGVVIIIIAIIMMFQ